MPSITPNLHFAGHCRDAIALYKQAFDAELTALLTESDANPRDWTSRGNTRDLVYHAEMRIGGQRIMMSDFAPDAPLSETHPMSLVVTFDTAEAVQAAYALLEPGGRIIHPMHSTTYSACFVSLVDRFGMRWELMTENA
ncbi:MAG: VOC family protein [Oscillospiraceae bacterium]|jgi:PhnB protein|nr:VOC family protein [Oscillospiraceae bacterium]